MKQPPATRQPEARPAAEGERRVQQVGINVEDEDVSPPGGAENVDESATSTKDDDSPRRLIILWVVLLISLVLFALPVLWAIGVFATLSPIAVALPAWVTWLLVITIAAVALVAVWLAYRFAAPGA